MAITACGGGGGSNSFLPPPSSNPPPPPPTPALLQLSTDTLTNNGSQHATEVEPHAFAFGTNVVSAFQVARNFGGGSAAIGFAMSTNGGTAWSNGLLPGITAFVGNGTYLAGSDPVVAYDAAHNTWLISTLAITSTGEDVLVSRSHDAATWGNPIRVSATQHSDKNWIACDNNSASPFFGRCYLQWDDPSDAAGGLVWMSVSSDGGLTWSTARNTADNFQGLGGQILIQPGGKVVIVIADSNVTQIRSFTSSDGGSSWSATTLVANVIDHQVGANLRNLSLPNATIDGAGNMYVIWYDCRFRVSCTANDIVLSTSSDGTTWTAPARIPLDNVNSNVDHFLPAVAADPATSGSTAHLALTYYFFSTANCPASTCQLRVASSSSADGGATWTAPTTLTPAMSIAWLPTTITGSMVGDYFGLAFSGGHAVPVFAVASANSGSTRNQAIVTLASLTSLSATANVRALEAIPAVTSKSDHEPRRHTPHEHPPIKK